MIVRELITRLGFDADQKKVNQFDASIKNLTKALAALVAGASAATAAAFKLASDTARYGDEVAKTSRLLGVGIEELQRYRFAFDRVGVSQEQTDAALRRFNVTLGQASQGMGQGAQIFNMLGVAIRSPSGEMRSMQDMMPDVMEALRGITNESQRAAIAQQLFGRSGAALVANLEGGGEELRALGAEFDALGGGLSGPQALAAEAFTDAMTNMQAAFRSLRLQVGARLMPIFQDLIESFTEFMQVNRELIMARIHRAFEILIGVMRVVMSVVRTLWRTIDGLAQTMGGWEVTLRVIAIALLAVFGAKMVTAIMAFSGAISAAGGAMALLRIASLKLAVAMKAIPLIAIIGLIVLLVDEIFNWMRGNDTVIGRVLGSWEDFKDRVMGVFTAVKDAAKEFWAGLVDVFDDTIMRPINAIADGFFAVMDVFTVVQDAAKRFWAGLVRVFNLAIIAPVQAFLDFWQMVFGAVTRGAKEFWSGLKAIFDLAILTPVQALFNLWKTVFTEVTAGAKSFWSGLKSIFDFAIGASVDAFLSAWQNMFTVVSDGARAFWGGLKTIFDLSIVRPIQIYQDMWKSVFGMVTGAAKSFWAELVSVFDGSIMAPINAIGDAFFAVMDRVRSMWGEVTQWMAGRIAGILPQWLQRRLGFSTDEEGAQPEPQSLADDGFDMPDFDAWTPETVASDMQSAEGGDVRNTTLNNRADINITVPPGTTQEQVQSIVEQIDRAMGRQIDNAALALEVR